ncbi:MAG: PTS fructose transporter subunit IIA [Halothiobacillaceae bacterium]|nr:PTS fructose transporter subunit IIA [Halothiobacillaceae bacterium]HER34074.1 PTS fructose transporter subunit IIA [Halothiobacillaceae bacterium]
MTVGILLICHNDIGAQLIETATDMLESLPTRLDHIDVHQDDDPIDLLNTARRRVTELDGGEGVLVMTDMYGSTPSNIAHRLRDRHAVQVLSGVNLPMLVRALNYPRLPLADMTAKACSGGRDGIIQEGASGTS